MPGTEVTVRQLARAIINAVGHGTLRTAPLPPDLAASEVGNQRFATRRLTDLIGAVPLTHLSDALAETVAYFEASQSVR